MKSTNNPDGPRSCSARGRWMHAKSRDVKLYTVNPGGLRVIAAVASGIRVEQVSRGKRVQ